MGSHFNDSTGATEHYYYDHSSDKIIVRHVVDVEGIIDQNKREFNSHSGGYGDSDGLHKIATIPLILIDKWKRENGFDWFNSTDKERRAWLDKPEHAFLKTRPGKLSGTTSNRLNSVRN